MLLLTEHNIAFKAVERLHQIQWQFWCQQRATCIKVYVHAF